MSINDRAENSGNGKRDTLIAGILLGMVLGLLVAGGVAWYIIKKNPASFENKEIREAPKPEPQIKIAPLPAPAPIPAPAPASVPEPVSASSPEAASAVSAPKQHFEFYKVLTDKPDSTPQKSPAKSAAAHSQPAKPAQPVETTKEVFLIQAGSFPKEEDADKLKAKLALLGLEARVEPAIISDRGTYHRVRLGPFNSSNEANKILSILKQNDLADAKLMKVQ